MVMRSRWPADWGDRACITVWVTFLPCSFFIVLGAPYCGSLEALRLALAGIGAAVVGVGRTSRCGSP
jgi:hypothetical protein